MPKSVRHFHLLFLQCHLRRRLARHGHDAGREDARSIKDDEIPKCTIKMTIAPATKMRARLQTEHYAILRIRNYAMRESALRRRCRRIPADDTMITTCAR